MNLEFFDLKNWMDQNSATENISQLPSHIFNSETSFLFLNDQLPNEKKSEIYQSLAAFLTESKQIATPSLLIPTSGTTSSELKLVVIEKQKFLNAAKRVNSFLGCRPTDTWLLSLPVHHVAGLSILARAYLSKAAVYKWTKWRAEEFVHKLKHWNIAYCSLVPTQIFDLTAKELTAPAQLKKVLVGGSALPDSQFQQMQKLSWPLIKTYGMSETSAFISVDAGDNENYYSPLPTVNVKLDAKKNLAIQCDSLFDCYLEQTRTSWQMIPKKLVQDYWSTEDSAEFSSIDETKFKVLGRGQGMIKIKGEIVNLQLLNSRLIEFTNQFLLASQGPLIHFLPEQRDEHELIAIVPKNIAEEKVKSAIAQFNKTVLPYERVGWYTLVDDLPRTDLGKIKIGLLNTVEFRKYCKENRKSVDGDLI